MADAELPGETREQDIQRELAKRIYDRADKLRLNALAKVGFDRADPGPRHRVLLSSPSYRLKVELSAESQLRQGGERLRLVSITDDVYQGNSFGFGRYIEADGTMWQAGDSSQGQPWYQADLPSATLVEVLERFDTLENSGYHIDVTLSSYQHVGAVAVSV